MNMNQSENAAPGSYIGHVRNGVIVPDAEIPFAEGQAVRIEPLEEADGAGISRERAERVRGLEKLFAKWTEEDAQLSDEEADRLQKALENNRGLTFRSPNLG